MGDLEFDLSRSLKAIGYTCRLSVLQSSNLKIFILPLDLLSVASEVSDALSYDLYALFFPVGVPRSA